MAEPVNPKITKEPPKAAPVTILKATGGPSKIEEPALVKAPEQSQM
jgi:hypothetical protein